MPEGRAELMRTIATLKGSYLPDLSNERMSDYEAYRINVFQDEAVADRVDRRWKNFRVLGREPTNLATDRGFEPQNRGSNIGIIKQDIAIRAAALYSQVAARNRATLLALERTVDALASVRGRKALVFVSPGFIDDQERREATFVLDAARRANVAVYFVDARGLLTGSPYGQAQFGSPLDARDVGATNADLTLEAEGAENLSVDSGGFSIRNANDLSGALRRIAGESEVYYLLGFQPDETGRAGAFRKLDVRVTRPGLQVRARRGYYAGGAPSRNEGRRARATFDDLSRAADSPYDLTAIPMRASSYVFGDAAPGKALTMLAVEADLRAFGFKRQSTGTLGDTLQTARPGHGTVDRVDGTLRARRRDDVSGDGAIRRRIVARRGRGVQAGAGPLPGTRGHSRREQWTGRRGHPRIRGAAARRAAGDDADRDRYDRDAVAHCRRRRRSPCSSSGDRFPPGQWSTTSSPCSANNEGRARRRQPRGPRGRWHGRQTAGAEADRAGGRWQPEPLLGHLHGGPGGR